MDRCVYLLTLILLSQFIFLPISPVIAQNKQKIEVTISGVASSEKLEHFMRAEELRKNLKFSEAIPEYLMVISPGEVCGKEPEAHYNIGLCYCWRGKKEDAGIIFKEVLNRFPDNPEVAAHAEFGLAWVDTQNGNFPSAINRLEQILDKRIWADYEFCAKVQHEIGRIYLSFIHDYDMAKKAFIKVLELYPGSKVADSTYLRYFK